MPMSGPCARIALTAAWTSSARLASRWACHRRRRPSGTLTASSVSSTLLVVTVTRGSSQSGGTVRVLVTGASGAFGSGTMRALAARGDRAVGLDVKPSCGVLACDLTDDDQVAGAVAQAREELGGLDAVVHFAGIGIPNDAGGPVDDAVLRTLQVHLLGAWRVTHATLPALVESRGRLVYTASELAYAVLPFVSAYSVAKRGLAAYADAVRFEYGSRVSVTTVYPGYVPTPIHDVGLSMGLSLEGKVRKEKVENVVGPVMKG